VESGEVETVGDEVLDQGIEAMLPLGSSMWGLSMYVAVRSSWSVMMSCKVLDKISSISETCAAQHCGERSERKEMVERPTNGTG
jgi:hypothetical protein